LEEPIDLRVMTLFDETDIEPYERKKAEAAFQAVLAATGWRTQDVIAVARPFDLLVIGMAGIVECSGAEVGDVVPWSEIIDVTPTEPTLRVYGIKVAIAGATTPRSYVWSGGGSQQDLSERNRIYRFLTGGS
jgi:hypothetical protein